MPGLLPNIDPDGLLEYSVVFTDRALNQMSKRFQRVMTDLAAVLKEVYAADAAIVMPGSGTFGMEAVARQFTGGKRALIVRNGLFSYRWSQILETGGITAGDEIRVLQAQRVRNDEQAPWAPPPIENVTAAIAEHEPAAVFAAHVETASGIILPDDYLREMAAATHAVGGLFVLDCIASGAMWVDMRATGVDVLLSAPQKGWSGAAGAALVCLSQIALKELESSASSSFALDLKQWLNVMQAYEEGGHRYYATLPTMTLLTLRDEMLEAKGRGFELLQEQQVVLGRRVRELLSSRGFPSVAAEGFQAPGVVVSYTTDPNVKSGKAFAEHGVQVAAGVPLQCGEPAGFSSFRVGLFGLDKLADVDAAVERLQKALDEMRFEVR